eukprot:41077_1
MQLSTDEKVQNKQSAVLRYGEYGHECNTESVPLSVLYIHQSSKFSLFITNKEVVAVHDDDNCKQIFKNLKNVEYITNIFTQRGDCDCGFIQTTDNIYAFIINELDKSNIRR